MANIEKISVPFRVIRLLLPPDGEVTRHIFKENVWPNNHEPFFRHEAIELAFGRKIRAKKEDRKDQAWWQPGIVDKGSHVLIRGGWRVHKKVPFHNDFFDGTLEAKLRLEMEEDELYPVMDALDVEWNKSVGGNIIDFFTLGHLLEFVEKQIEKRIVAEVNKFVKENMKKEIDKIINSNERLKDLYERSTIEADGTTLVFSVNTD